MYSQNKKLKKMYLVSAVVVAVAGLGGGALYWSQHRTKKTDSQSGVNLSPATAEEKKQAEDNKDKIAAEIDKNKAESTDQNGNPPTVKKDGTVTITYSGLYGDNFEAGAFLGNVFEDGGTCTLTMKKGGLTVTRDSKGFKDVSSTTCTPFSIAKSEFKEVGTWTFKVSYNSATISGTSSEKTVEIK